MFAFAIFAFASYTKIKYILTSDNISDKTHTSVTLAGYTANLRWMHSIFSILYATYGG